jgi:hypothetical protein
MIDWLADHFDYYPGDCEDDDRIDEYDPDDEWECEFGEKCLMPSFYHRRDECHTVEMALAWQEEQEATA